MIVTPIKTRVFKEGEDLFSFVTHYTKKLPERSVVVVTSKIVSLAEGRTAAAKTEKEKVKLIRSESEWAMRTKYVWLTVKDNMVMSSAGIDESNADGKVILLPKDSFKTARVLRKKLQKKYGVKNLGVLIPDSRTAPLRLGVTGAAIGYAGFKGVRDYRGTKDIFGRVFKFVRTNIADSLATAAVLVMGEGGEKTPLAIISKAPVEFSERTRRDELSIDIEDDLYKPFFARTLRARKPKGRT